MEEPMEQTESNPNISEPLEPEKQEDTPRGAMTFVLLLGLFYVFYYFLTWFEVMVLRGS